jgi:hypothetical protein
MEIMPMERLGGAAGPTPITDIAMTAVAALLMSFGIERGEVGRALSSGALLKRRNQ